MPLPSEFIRKPDIPNTESILQERKANMNALTRKLKHPRKLFYPAGYADMLPLVVPSVEVMAIVDFVPLLLPDESNMTRNSYSRALHTILEEKNGEYIAFADLFTDSSEDVDDFMSTPFGYNERADLSENVRLSMKQILAAAALVDGSYAPSTIQSKAFVNSDSFSDVLANIIVYGGDLDTMQLGKFGNDYRIQFTLDGVRKTVIFNDTQIEDTFSDTDSSTYRWASRCFDGYEEGTTALVVKADYHHVAQHVVDAVEPDIIFGTGPSMDTIRRTAGFRSGIYRFSGIKRGELPYSKRKWGYDDIGTMVIGEKVTDSGSGVLKRRGLND